MINLYWGLDNRYYNPLIDELPERLTNSKEWKELGEIAGYKKCYSGIHHNKNIFVVRSRFSFVFEQLENQEYRIINQNQDWVDKFIDFNGLSENVIQFKFNEWVFSDKSLNMSLVPCYMSKNNFTESSIFLPGTYNINKWFRPINCGFIQTKKYIEIKEGDPLYYIKFETEEPLKITPFRMTDRLQELSDYCSMVKGRKKGKNLAYLYEKFTNKIQKTVLKEIKKSII